MPPRGGCVCSSVGLVRGVLGQSLRCRLARGTRSPHQRVSGGVEIRLPVGKSGSVFHTRREHKFDSWVATRECRTPGREATAMTLAGAPLFYLSENMWDEEAMSDQLCWVIREVMMWAVGCCDATVGSRMRSTPGSASVELRRSAPVVKEHPDSDPWRAPKEWAKSWRKACCEAKAGRRSICRRESSPGGALETGKDFDTRLKIYNLQVKQISVWVPILFIRSGRVGLTLHRLTSPRLVFSRPLTATWRRAVVCQPVIKAPCLRLRPWCAPMCLKEFEIARRR